MNAKQFKYVLVLANEGSFSRAADSLNISQPSLSQYVKKIEKQIGLPLFDRTNGDVRLTDAGQIYINTGRKILDLEHQMDRKLSDLMTHKTGSLIIGTTPYRAASIIPIIASSFQKLHPGMHLIIREGTTTELIEGMGRGEYDLCLTMLPLDTNLFSYEKVINEEIVLAVPASYSLLPTAVTTLESQSSKYNPIAPAVLNNKRLIILTEGQFMQKQLDALVTAYHLTIHTAAVVKSLEAQIEFVKAGVGMAVVPSGIERFCSRQEVTFYSFAAPLPKREVVVMWRKDRELSKTATELKNIILNTEW